MVSPRGLSKAWASAAGDLLDDERKLAEQIAKFIVARWQNKSTESENPKQAFAEMYKNNKDHALGLVCAIIEASRAVADGRDPREEMLEALDKGVCH